MKKKTNEVKVSTEIENIVNEFLIQLQVTGTVEVKETIETEKAPADAKDMAGKKAKAGEEDDKSDSKKTVPDKSFTVNIKTEESGLLIGHHGETINSLQLLIGVILYKKLGKWVRVLVDIGDYRKMREESIKEMVDRIAAEVEQSGRGVELPFLSPLERRIVHMMLSENSKVMSESTGEGRDRRVMIKPRLNG